MNPTVKKYLINHKGFEPAIKVVRNETLIKKCLLLQKANRIGKIKIAFLAYFLDVVFILRLFWLFLWHKKYSIFGGKKLLIENCWRLYLEMNQLTISLPWRLQQQQWTGSRTQMPRTRANPPWPAKLSWFYLGQLEVRISL